MQRSILVSFVTINAAGRYSMYIKLLNDQVHLDNYISYLQKTGTKIVDHKILVN